MVYRADDIASGDKNLTLPLPLMTSLRYESNGLSHISIQPNSTITHS
jgi:hypothetical protein